MKDEGYIKYKCIWQDASIAVPESVFRLLNLWREKLFGLSLIGMYENGIGFGNISVKNDDGSFFITGSATGGKPVLELDDYAMVTKWNFEKNQLHCTGKTKASSESLTHAAIYESNNKISSVIHVHATGIWKNFLKKMPTTGEEILYGTPEMAIGIKNLLENKDNIEKGIVVMGGHEEGILTFGKDLDEAGDRILEYYYQSLNKSAISNADDK